MKCQCTYTAPSCEQGVRLWNELDEARNQLKAILVPGRVDWTYSDLFKAAHARYHDHVSGMDFSCHRCGAALQPTMNCNYDPQRICFECVEEQRNG